MTIEILTKDEKRRRDALTPFEQCEEIKSRSLKPINDMLKSIQELKDEVQQVRKEVNSS